MTRRRARRGPRAAARIAVLAVLLAVLSACGSGYHPAGPFRPVPEGAPPEVGPPPSDGPAPAPAPGQPNDPGSGQQTPGDPNVVATGLSIPTGIAILPDGTALVGERATGRILKVFPDHSPVRELMTIPGVDPTGDGGLLGLALSPTFAEDGLVYAYVSTPVDNRVVRFPLGGIPNPVLTGIPHGPTRNGGALLFGSDGTLFVGTGDTGNAALAQDPTSLAGKVLHVDVFGHPAGNGEIFSSGHGDVTGLCVGGDQKIYASDDLATTDDQLSRLTEGDDHGYPTPLPTSSGPVVDFPGPDGGLGGCAAAASTVFVSALDGQRIYVVSLGRNGNSTGTPQDFLKGQYGRLRSVAIDPQGALWITTSNKDGVGTPGPDDDRVLRIVPPTSSGNSPL